MNAGQKNTLREMSFIDCEREMFEMMEKEAAELGFDFFSFGMRTPLPITNPVAVVISSYPKVFQQVYQEADYVGIDPVVQHVLSGGDMITWTDETRFSRNSEVWHVTRSAGILSGVSHPIRGAQGVACLLDLSGYNRALPTSEVEDKKARIIWLANMAYKKLSPYLISNYMPAAEVKLTEQEILVLRWLAEGKTTEEVAKILKIAKRTVDFHINNAVEKLGVANRTAATVQAALLGIL